MSAESQGSTGRRRVTCAQGAETYPSIFTRDDDGVASSGETRSEVVESEGRGGLRPPPREKELTSLDAIPDDMPVDSNARRSRRTRRATMHSTDAGSACQRRQGLGYVCESTCGCSNSIPVTASAKAVPVKGWDMDSDSKGLVARCDIEADEIITVFGNTAYIPAASSAGREFEERHAGDTAQAIPPLQFSLCYHLADSTDAKTWAVPEADRQALFQRKDVPTALNKMTLSDSTSHHTRRRTNHHSAKAKLYAYTGG